jgi:predicted acylesterase/phospholipase RssA
MVKHLVVGPGAMGYFMYLGVLSKLKQEGRLNELEEISGSSAGGLASFIYVLTKGNIPAALDYSLSIPVNSIMKPNIKSLLNNYGLVSSKKVRKVLADICKKFTDKDDITFKELYEWNPIKLHLPAYCVDFMKTVYFNIDSVPNMSVLDAVTATIAVPFLFAPVKLADGYNYVDGATAEAIPAGPFVGLNDVLALRIAWGRLSEVKDLKSYALSILYSSMKLRHVYEVPTHDIDIPDDDIYDFSASNENKLKMFMFGLSQNFSK